MNRLARSLVLGCLLVVLGSSAARADAELGLSRDGSTWSSDVSMPLFDPSLRWVPGDQRVATFYARNQSGDTGNLSVDLLGTRIDSLLETGDLTISVREDDGAWRDTSSPGAHRLLADAALARGAVARVDVRVAFDPASTNQSQVLDLTLAFRARLTQSSTGGADRGSDDGGLLPDTGAPALWPLILGLALLGVGTIVASRRPAKEDHHG